MFIEALSRMSIQIEHLVDMENIRNVLRTSYVSSNNNNNN